MGPGRSRLRLPFGGSLRFPIHWKEYQTSNQGTLLNSIFSTRFDVMNSMGGRTQTTKGIWISKEPHSNILVMDVEGTDGRERGEDQVCLLTDAGFREEECPLFNCNGRNLNNQHVGACGWTL